MRAQSHRETVVGWKRKKWEEGPAGKAAPVASGDIRNPQFGRNDAAFSGLYNLKFNASAVLKQIDCLEFVDKALHEALRILFHKAKASQLGTDNAITKWLTEHVERDDLGGKIHRRPRNQVRNSPAA